MAAMANVSVAIKCKYGVNDLGRVWNAESVVLAVNQNDKQKVLVLIVVAGYHEHRVHVKGTLEIGYRASDKYRSTHFATDLSTSNLVAHKYNVEEEKRSLL